MTKPVPHNSLNAGTNDPLTADDKALLSGSPGFYSDAPAGPEALYLVEPGDTSAVSIDDINQGSIGDCFVLSSIGELALRDPVAVQSMIQSNANGTETVNLYAPQQVGPFIHGTGALQKVPVTVTNSFPSNAVNSGPSLDVVNGVKEIWPQVLEKAVAALDESYAAIADGGSPIVAMEQLTGQTATAVSPAALTASVLQSGIAAGDLFVMDTANLSNLPYDLVGNHAYMFEGMNTVGGATMVQLGNPWGSSYNPPPIPLANLASSGIVEVDVGRVA